MPDQLLSDWEMVSQLLGIDSWKWTPALFQAVFPDSEGHWTVPQHLGGHDLTCNVMVGAPGWHFEFVPTARPQGSEILLPVEIQGNSLPWQWAQGKRKKDKKGHRRQPVSEGMLSCYLTQLLVEEVALCSQHSRNLLCCNFLSQYILPTRWDMVVTVLGAGAFKDWDLQLGAMFLFFFFFLLFFPFLTWTVTGEKEREGKKEVKIMEKWKIAIPLKKKVKNKSGLSNHVLWKCLGYTCYTFFKISNIWLSYEDSYRDCFCEFASFMMGEALAKPLSV